MGKVCICEVTQFFDEDFDGTLCKVRKVLQVFDNQDQAADAMPLFDPSRYEDYDTVIRMVPASELDTKFR